MTPVRYPAFPLVLALAVCACGGEGDRTEHSSEDPALPPDLASMTPRVALETTKGRIVLELDRAKAPTTVESFVEHVRAGFYDGLIFHRVIPNFMVQAGGFTPELGRRESNRPTLQNEADNGLKNVRGAVAMARTSDPHSARTQFFINVADNPNLNHTSRTPQGWGYTVFGRVVEGMDAVDSIAAVPTTSRGGMNDVPTEPVVIERAHLADEGASAE